MTEPRKSLADRAMAFAGGWAMRHIELLFRIARNLVPILRVTYRGQRFALVTRYDDVAEVMNQPDVFNVIYAPKLAVIMGGGNIFLGMADTPEAMRDRTALRLAVPRGEATSRVPPAIDALANAVIAGAAPSGQLDLAMALTQTVTTRFFADHIGITGPDEVAYADQARMLFDFMFADLGNDPVLRAKAEPAAASLRALVDETIARRKGARGSHDDILERCLSLQDIATPGMDDIGIRNNLIGLIVGGLPQPPMVVPQLFDVLLDRPTELAAAQAAAHADDDTTVSRYIFEALRYYPLTPGLFRDCTTDYKLAGGMWRGRTISAGTRVFAATRSAMFDGRRVTDPSSFRIDRPDQHYMHFGHGMHTCFGLYINRAMIPAICKAVLKLPGLRRAAGESGRLRMEGIFAMNLTVAFDAGQP